MTRIGTLPTPARTGYTFGGWFTEAAGGTQVTNSTKVEITAPQTLYAHWTAIPYTVTFDSNGGSDVAALTVDYGKAASAPSEPTKTGYTFGGWFSGSSAYDFSTLITGNITLTARWTANTYTVTYDLDDGVHPPIVFDETYDGAYANLPAPEKEGYTFAGWWTDRTGGTQIDTSQVKIADNHTLYARWTINTYTVSFDTNGGNDVADQNVTFRDKAAPAVPTRTGYTFVEWCSHIHTLSSPTKADITLLKIEPRRSLIREVPGFSFTVLFSCYGTQK